MRLLADLVPGARDGATAQTLYATLGLGLVNTVLNRALAGELYGRFGADAFWSMAALCLAAMPVAMTLGSPALRNPTLRRSAGDGA